MRPFRFLVDTGDALDAAGVIAVARRAEAAGADTRVFPDHVIHPFGVLPLLATIAAATDRLRVAPFVMNNDFRHPAILAQDLATVDLLSGGRLDVAIGAGWNKPEYDALGLAFDPQPVRVARLAEAIAVLKGCFRDGPFSFAGSFYTITDHDAQPKPVQRPHPPLMVGGGGRRVLELAGREADIVSFSPRMLPGQGPAAPRDPRSITLAATEEKIGWVRAAAGERFDALDLNVYPSLVAPTLTAPGDERRVAADLAATIEQRTGITLTVDEMLEAPNVFVGSVDSLVAKLRRLRTGLGINSFMVGDIATLGPVVERLAGE